MKRLFPALVVVVILLATYVGAMLYSRIMRDNVKNDQEKYNIYIPSDASYREVMLLLRQHDLFISYESFRWLADLMGYQKKVQSGRYIIWNNMSNLDIIRILRSGSQKPVRVVLNKLRTKKDIVSFFSSQLEADSSELSELLNDPSFLTPLDFAPEHATAIFIPNTYEFYWNTTAEELIKRMARENKVFWNDDRLNKCKEVDLTPLEVYILASIVEEESNYKSERARIAGVYINRLRKGWPLQADPTVKFAVGDFSIKRILFKHLEYESPYNTYLHKGLPPGPICIPSIHAIDAVLSAEKHNYMFFCANSDFSGKHVFAETKAQHDLNAYKFRKALDAR